MKEKMSELKNALFDLEDGLCFTEIEKFADFQLDKICQILNDMDVTKMTMEEYLEYSMVVIEFVSAKANSLGSEEKYTDLFYKMHAKIIESDYYRELI